MPTGDDEFRVSLRDFLLALTDAADRRYEQRFRDQERAVDAALDAAAKAVDKAELASEKRFDAVNEFRAQQADLIAGFLPRPEYLAQHHALEDKVVAFEERLNVSLARVHSRLDMSEGRSSGIAAGWGYLVAAVSAVGVIVAIVYAITR